MTTPKNNFKQQESIKFVSELIKSSRNTVILSGAGISTPSGIPDFRSEGTGLWAKDEPLEVASLTTFRHSPKKFFDWIRPLIKLIVNAQPNPAHDAITSLENAGFIKTIITQNIDNLHQKSGSKNVIETHGSILKMTCTKCFYKTSSDPYIKSFINDGQIPFCPKCESILKPDVILFGEQMPHLPWENALSAARNCDLMIVAGSSLEVLPVAGIPMQALDRGAHLVIINQTPTYLGVRADMVILDDVAILMPEICRQVLGV
jgi:NAD-dependent deacetylase